MWPRIARNWRFLLALVLPASLFPAASSGSRTSWAARSRRLTLPLQKVVQTVETDNRPTGVAASGDTVYVAVQTHGRAHRDGTLTLLSQPRSAYEPKIDPPVVCEPTGSQMLTLTNDGLTGFKRTGGSDGTRLVADLATSLPATS